MFGEPGTDGTFSVSFASMARLARVTVVVLPHHVTRRGNTRHFILADDADRVIYLDLLHRCSQLHDLKLLGYCDR